MVPLNLINNINCNKELFIDICISIFIIVLGFLCFFKAGVPTSGYSSTFILQGLRILSESTYDFYERGPIFPLLIALSYKLLGISVKSAFIVVRLLMIFGWVAIYWLTLNLYSRKIAIAALALIITSYGMNLIGEFVTPDTIVPCLIIIFFVFLNVAFRKKTFYLFAFTGFLLGLSILTKEVSLIFLPLPILMFVFNPEVRTWQIGLRLLLLYLFTMIPVFIWVNYIGERGAPVSSIASLAGGLYSEQLLPNIQEKQFTVLDYLQDIVAKIRFSYKAYFLTTSHYLGSFFIIAWSAIFARFIIVRDQTNAFMISVFICSMPLLIAVGGVQPRLGQIGFFVLLSYIALVSILSSGITKLLSIQVVEETIAEKRFLVNHVLFWGSIFLIMTIQIFFSPNPTVNIYSGKEHNRHENVPFTHNKFAVSGQLSNDVKDACSWLIGQKKNDEAMKIITTSSYQAVDFFSNLQLENYRFHPIIIDDSELEKRIQNGDLLKDDKLLFINSHKKFGGKVKRYNNVQFIFEKDIINSIRQIKPDYIWLSTWKKYLEFYFDYAYYAEKMYSNNSVSIYKIYNDKVVSVEESSLLVSNLFNNRIKYFKKEYPAKYKRLINNLAFLGLTEIDLVRNGYSEKQLFIMAKRLIGMGKKVAYVGPQQIDSIIKDSVPFSITNISPDITKNKIKNIKNIYDYLLIKGSSKGYKNVRKIVSSEDLVYTFPNLLYFGDGSMLYKIK